MMKKYFRWACLFLVCFLIVACSDKSDDLMTADGKVKVTKVVDFSVSFADFGADEVHNLTRNVTRDTAVAKPQVVDLGNNLLALVTIKKDTTVTVAQARTRVLENDTYTMIAYQGGVNKGELKGTISGGKFTPMGSETSLELEPGTYQFVLFNDEFIRNGDVLSVLYSTAKTAIVGRATYVVTTNPHHQEVKFEMKHAAARVHVRVTAYDNFKITPGYPASGKTTMNVQLSEAAVNSTSGESYYDLKTGTWTLKYPDIGGGASVSIPFTTEPTANTDGKTYSATSDYSYMIPKTILGAFNFNILGGTVYGKLVRGGMGSINVPTLEANGSYLIDVKLVYSFAYLTDNGTVLLTRQLADLPTTPAWGTKVIALVVSRSKKMAIALTDANNGNAAAFVQHSWGGAWHLDNPVQYKWGTREFYNDLLSWQYDYRYTDGQDLINQYASNLAAVTPLTGALASAKWYMPSAGVWRLLFTAVGLGDPTTMDSGTEANRQYGPFPWRGNLVELAFTQVGGTMPSGDYWTCTDEETGYTGTCSMQATNIGFAYAYTYGECKIRPFITW